MSNQYSRGRSAERAVVTRLRELGLYAVRIPLSKGFYVVNHDGSYSICRGDVAAWTAQGMPVAIEVKRVSKRRRQESSLHKMIMYRMKNHDDNTLLVVVGRGAKMSYYTYHKNGNDSLFSMSENEFVREVCRRSRELAQKSGLSCCVIPIV
ncbi:MAG: hypothetical protein QXY15_10885 [Candidatus Nitrosotenuis sp.]